ncbi:MAG: hypothetical protein ACFB51_17560 [Anaerolineae bacterium]
MRKFLALFVAAGVLLVASVPARADDAVINVVTIDSFILDHPTIEATDANDLQTSVASGAGVIGGDRDLAVLITQLSPYPNDVARVGVSGGELLYEQIGANGTSDDLAAAGFIQYDGPDGNASPFGGLDPDGLGGIDLTEGGTVNAFCVTIEATTEIDLGFTVYTPDPNDMDNTDFDSILNYDLDEMDTPTVIVYPFSAFQPLDESEQADFSDVGAIGVGFGSTTESPGDEDPSRIGITILDISTCTTPVFTNILTNPNFDDEPAPGAWSGFNGDIADNVGNAQTGDKYFLVRVDASSGPAFARQTVTQSGSGGDVWELLYFMGGRFVPIGTQGARITYLNGGGTVNQANCAENNYGNFFWTLTQCVGQAAGTYDQIRVEIGLYTDGTPGFYGLDTVRLRQIGVPLSDVRR